MLKKLYKYDLKSVSLLLFILHAVLIVYTVIGRIGIFVAEKAQAFSSLEASRLWGIAGAFYIWDLFYLFSPLQLQRLYF